MRKITPYLIIIVFFISTISQAQDENQAFDEGRLIVTAGYGVPNLSRLGLRTFFKKFDEYAVRGYGPLLIKGEYGIIKQLGVGVAIGYSSSSITYYDNDYYYNGFNTIYYTYQEFIKWKSFSLGAHANYHFLTSEKLDVYAGSSVGYTYNHIEYTNNDPYYGIHTGNYFYRNPSALYFSATVGIRYYFTPNIGVYGEVGLDKWSLLQGGLALKF